MMTLVVLCGSGSPPGHTYQTCPKLTQALTGRSMKHQTTDYRMVVSKLVQVALHRGMSWTWKLTCGRLLPKSWLLLVVCRRMPVRGTLSPVQRVRRMR